MEETKERKGFSVKEIYQKIKSGYFVELEVYEYRIAQCYKPCDQLIKGLVEKDDRCNECGCFIWAKAWLKKKHCQHKKDGNKWPITLNEKSQ